MFDATKLPTVPSQVAAGTTSESVVTATSRPSGGASASAAGGSKPPGYPAKKMVLEGGRYRIADPEK